MKRILLLGATGSIGSSTLDVVRRYPDRYCLAGVSANTQAAKLSAITREFRVEKSILAGRDGTENLLAMIRETEAEIVVNGIAGASGLAPSIAALESGKNLALANKETIVMAGNLIRDLAAEAGQSIIPVDSEHAALFYLLEGIPEQRISRLVLTASGGAFRDKALEELDAVTVEDAVAHPTWSMGQKISIDSATMANKGLEIIEATRLFDIPVDKIDVFIHRQSTIHAMVETIDGSFYAQMSNPDMKLPIQHALSFPEELPSAVPRLDLDGLHFSFEAPDASKYPALALARKAATLGEGHTIAYNAANEVAVDAFMLGRIGFTGIAGIIEASLAPAWEKLVPSFGQVYEIDVRAREFAESVIDRSFSLR